MGFACFEGLFKVSYAIPERQGHVTEVPDVGRLASDKESFAQRQKGVASIFLLDQRGSDETIKNNPRCTGVGAGFASNFVRRIKPFINQSEEIVFKGCVQDLTVGRINGRDDNSSCVFPG